MKDTQRTSKEHWSQSRVYRLLWAFNPITNARKIIYKDRVSISLFQSQIFWNQCLKYNLISHEGFNEWKWEKLWSGQMAGKVEDLDARMTQEGTLKVGKWKVIIVGNVSMQEIIEDILPLSYWAHMWVLSHPSSLIPCSHQPIHWSDF